MPPPAASPTSTVLIVRYLDQTSRVRMGESITLGRADDCDISVLGEQASRYHARIEGLNGQFVYIDQSTNGSYVRSGQNEPTYLRNNETTLQGEGRIFLGASCDEDELWWVEFRVVV